MLNRKIKNSETFISSLMDLPSLKSPSRSSSVTLKYEGISVHSSKSIGLHPFRSCQPWHTSVSHLLKKWVKSVKVYYTRNKTVWQFLKFTTRLLLLCFLLLSLAKCYRCSTTSVEITTWQLVCKTPFWSSFLIILNIVAQKTAVHLS